MKKRRPTYPLLREGFIDTDGKKALSLLWMVRHPKKAVGLIWSQPGKILKFILRQPKKFLCGIPSKTPSRSENKFFAPCIDLKTGSRAKAVLKELLAVASKGPSKGPEESGNARRMPGRISPSVHSTPRILIDLQCCQGASGVRGIGRYALELTKAMARNAGAQWEIWVILNDRMPDTILRLRDQLREHIPQERIRIISLPLPLDSSKESNVRYLELNRQVYCHAVTELEPDLLLVGSIFEGYGDDIAAMFGGLPAHISRAVIAYDLIPYLHQESVLPGRIREWYFRQLNEFKQAQKFLAISANTRQDLIRHLQFKPEAIVNISAGISAMFQQRHVSEPEKQKLTRRLGITKPFLLYTGSFEPHKNARKAIEAYSRLDRSVRDSHQFVIISPPQAGLAETKRQLLQDFSLDPDGIVLAGRVTDEELIQLYNLSKAFIFPSLYEGFGFPPLEAMSCGVPTIASNTSSLPEVIGREDAMFDPLSVESIQEKIQRVLCDDAFRADLAAHALAQSKKFSWDITARKALDFLVPKAQKRAGVENRRLLIKNLGEVVKRTGRLEGRELALLARSVAMNDTSPRRPQILYEVSSLAHFDAKTGIQRVTRNILTHLIKITAGVYEVRPVRFQDGEFFYADRFAASYAGAEERTHVEDLPVEAVPGSIYLAVDLYLQGNNGYVQALQKFLSWNVPCYFVVYDLIPIRFPMFASSGIRNLFTPWLKNIASHASGLIAISEATQNDLIQWMRENQIEQRPGLRIGHFHLGADIQNDISYHLGGGALPAALPVNLRSRTTFLVVSTIEPRKGHEQILAAFEQLWAEGHDLNLIFVGQKGWVDDAFISRLNSHPESGCRFHWLSGVSDMELNQLYQACAALIFASYAEGFGLAIVEAAQHGTPLILRDLPVFREVALDHAFYFHADKPAELASAVKEWLKLSDNGSAPSSRGVSYLNWEESTRMLVQAIGIQVCTASLRSAHPRGKHALLRHLEK